MSYILKILFLKKQKTKKKLNLLNYFERNYNCSISTNVIL